MYINTSSKLVKNTSNISGNTVNNSEGRNNDTAGNPASNDISTSNGPQSISPNSMSPTRIFPDADFNSNPNTSFLSSHVDRNDLQFSPSRNIPFHNNNDNNCTVSASTFKPNAYSMKTKQGVPSISSLEFIKRPKRINEFNQRSRDDDLIRLNTAKNRYIPSRSKSLPFNSMKLKSSLRFSSGQNGEPARSKSVHFDESLPIKYFYKYECPTRVSRENSDCEVIGKINFDTVKPLHRYHSDSDSDSDSENDITDFKEDGLYDMNFSVLNSTSNNKDLQLNIFVNNKNDSNIMLQSIKLEKRRSYNNFFDYFIWGKVSVKNLFYEKYIYIRYTFNHWGTFNEVKAQYVQDLSLKSSLVDYDTFEFTLYSLESLVSNANGNDQNSDSFSNKSNVIEGDLEFCIHYETKDPNNQKMIDFWDNNNGRNYKIHLVLHTQEENNNMSTDNVDSKESKQGNDNQEYSMFQTDRYYNVANELGGFNRRNEKNNFQLDDYEIADTSLPTNRHYNLNNIKANRLLIPQNNKTYKMSDNEERNSRPRFFKDFRNPFVN